MGVALDDPVNTPAEVAYITIDPRHTEAARGKAAAPHTRVHVHTQLTVLGLRCLGLSAAPQKVHVGDCR